MQVRDREIAAVEYPAADGEPMAETDLHIQVMSDLRFTLRDFFRNESDVYVATNLLLYYVEGDSRRRVAPDVFVARGVGNHQRRIYKLWAEQRPPEVVIELSSRQTWREDLQVKWRLYEQLGVSEYFIFDPEYDYLDTPLVGYRLDTAQSKQYVPLEVVAGRVHSEALNLDLVDTGATLRLLDPRTGEMLPTPQEEAEARRAETEARQRAEAEVTQLRAELQRLRNEAS